MDSPRFLRPLCLVLSALAIAAGGVGMAASFIFLAGSGMADLTAGGAGFVAGAILVASGLLSMTMLATRPARSESKEPSYSEIA